MISTSISNNSITVVVTSCDKNKVYTLARSHPNYNAVIEAIRNNDEVLIQSLCDVSKTIVTFTEGNVKVENGHVYYNNNILDGIIVDRIIGFISDKLPVQPLLKFINKLYDNPSSRAVSELYKFLEHKNMPITPDGNFLAYKGVSADYFSVTSGNIEVIKGTVKNGRIYNGIGEEIEVKRNQVCDDKDIGCSKGIHAGSVKYATEFICGTGRVVIVEIDPRDVVSIPSDCDCQKLRACAYKVVGEFERNLNDNYCDTFSSSTDDSDSHLYDESLLDEDKSESAYNSGFDSGYSDGVNNIGFDDTIDDSDYYYSEELLFDENEDKANDLSLSWKDGYQDGYDEGVYDRRIETDSKDIG